MLARNDGNVARTFAQGTASCWSGYYHGVLERSLLAVQSYTRGALAPVARGLCADAEVRAVTWLAFQCLHGLGHGLMISTGYDLRLALDVCRRLATEWDAEACKGGAFMENLSPMYGGQSRWLRDDDPLYPCGVVAAPDRYECYKRVTTRILMVIGFEWERVAEMCASLEADYVRACFTSFGRDVSAQNERNPDDIVRLCEIARPYGAERTCISAAAVDITSNYANGARAVGVCEAASMRLRGSCYESIGTIMGRFRRTAAERVADCRALTPVPESVARCIRGARRSSDMVASPLSSSHEGRTSVRPARLILDDGRPARRPRRARAQPEERHRPHPAERARLRHRALRLGEVVARVRHDLRRGAAALRRVALRLRAAVPADDGEARRRLDRRALAGDLDRPEDDLAQPALDRRHGDRDLRLPAPALRADRTAALPDLRAADRGAVARPDRRAGAAPRRRGRSSP